MGCVGPPVVADYSGHAGRRGSPWPAWLPDPALCGGCWLLVGGAAPGGVLSGAVACAILLVGGAGSLQDWLLGVGGVPEPMLASW